MTAVLAVCRIILRFFQFILWLVLIPFIILIMCIRMVISRLKFKSQLKRSGMNDEWAKKLSKRYTLRFSDIAYMIRFAKRNKAGEAH